MELLVHIAAPSARKDDDRVKAQARAYSAFQVANTVTIKNQYDQVEASELDETSEMVLPAVGSQDLTLSRWSPSVFLDDTQLARTALESQVLTSSLDPGLHLESQHDQVSPSRSTLVSEIESSSVHGADPSNSHPESFLKRLRPDPSPDSAAKRPRVLSSPFVPLQESTGLALGFVGSHGSPSKQAVSPHAVPGPDHRRDSTSSDDIPSQLPSTYSLSDVSQHASHINTLLPPSSPAEAGPSTPAFKSSVGKHAHHSSSQSFPATGDTSSGRREVTPIQSTDSVPGQNGHAAQQTPTPPKSTSLLETAKSIAVSSAPVASEPGASSREKASRIHATHPTLKVTESVIAMPPPPRPMANSSALQMPNTPSKPEDMATLEELPQSITPDPPPTSIDLFQSHMTAFLEKLSHDMGPSCCYDRSTIHREPRQSERGYWHICTSMWSVTVQIAFWQFLQLHVRSGNLGWGVWCVREVDESGSGTGKSGGGLGDVKVFCWGEVVKHVYLLLYVASKSKIRKASARWIDADGEVVVEM